jgi:hypothetical protein
MILEARDKASPKGTEKKQHNLQLKQDPYRDHILWTSNCTQVPETTFAGIALQCD